MNIYGYTTLILINYYTVDNKEYIDQGEMLISSCTWLTNEMDVMVDKINSMDVDAMSVDELTKYIKQCEGLLRRSQWEDEQITQFLSR